MTSLMAPHILYQGIIKCSYQPQDFKDCTLGIEFPWRTPKECGGIRKTVIREEMFFPLVCEWRSLAHATGKE